MIHVAVIPSQSNRIRALHGAEPKLTPRQLAARLGCHHRLVELALAKGDTLRTKSRVAADGGHAR